MRVLVRPYCYQSKAIDCNDAINKSCRNISFFFGSCDLFNHKGINIM